MKLCLCVCLWMWLACSTTFTDTKEMPKGEILLKFISIILLCLKEITINNKSATCVPTLINCNSVICFLIFYSVVDNKALISLQNFLPFMTIKWTKILTFHETLTSKLLITCKHLCITTKNIIYFKLLTK